MRCLSFREGVFLTSFSPDLGPTEQSWGRFATRIVTKNQNLPNFSDARNDCPKTKTKEIIKKMKN
jgi:hypothetical protein